MLAQSFHSHDNEDHLPPGENTIGSLAHAIPGLLVPRVPGPGGGDKDDETGFDAVDDADNGDGVKV